MLFVDRRLAVEQQLSVLVELLLDFQLELSAEEEESLSGHVRALIERRRNGLANKAESLHP